MIFWLSMPPGWISFRRGTELTVLGLWSMSIHVCRLFFLNEYKIPYIPKGKVLSSMKPNLKLSMPGFNVTSPGQRAQELPSFPSMFHHEVINRHVQPDSKVQLSARFRARDPAGPRDKGRPGQVEKIVHGPVWCWKFSKTEKMLIEAKLSYR